MINSQAFFTGLKSLKGARSPALPLAACFVAWGALLKDGIEASLPEPSIKNKYFEMNPISSEEARKQLDLIDHDFYVFRNKKNNELQVIYKRNHGGYGLIQSK